MVREDARKRSIGSILLVLLASNAALPGQPRSKTTPPDSYAVGQVGRYRFQSNPWVNLHQRLMHEARFQTPPPAALSAEDLSKWKQAVEAYRAFLGKRSWIFDAELVRMNAELSAATERKPPRPIPKAAMPKKTQ